MTETINLTAEQNTKLNGYVEHIKAEYLKAGGAKESLRSDDAIWYALAGILYRDGESALEQFIKDWKPILP